MKNIPTFVAHQLEEVGVVTKENIDVCRYGIEIFICSFLEISSIIILSFFVGNFICTILFFLSFVPLRAYAGGYHADSKLRCYLLLVFVYAIFSLLLIYIPNKYIEHINVIFLFITIPVVITFSPVLHRQRSFTTQEVVLYKKTSIIIMFVESALILSGSAFFSDSKYILAFSLGYGTVSLSMIAAIVKNIRR